MSATLRVTSCKVTKGLRRYSWWRGRTLIYQVLLVNGNFYELDVLGATYRVIGGEKAQWWDPYVGWEDA